MAAAREDRSKGSTAAAREADTRAAAARAATWSLVRLILVQNLSLQCSNAGSTTASSWTT
jgi:hypothetical protein